MRPVPMKTRVNLLAAGMFLIVAGSTLAAVLFHFMINFTGTFIEISPLTKFIQMILLFVIAGILVVRNRNIFTNKASVFKTSV